MRFAVAYCIFVVVTTVYAKGPAAQEEKWEECNVAQDNGLAHLGNSFNSTEFYTMSASDPCTKCNVWFLGTIKRTGDVPYRELKPGTIKHEMKIGFSIVHILCKCKDTSGNEGEIFDIWTEPRGTVDMLTNSKEGKVQFENARVMSDMASTNKIECRGGDKWKQSCDEFKQKRSFDASIKLAVERLFPNESATKIQNEKALLDKLKCA